MPGINIEGTKSRNAWESTAIRVDVMLDNGTWYRVTACEVANGDGQWRWHIRCLPHTDHVADGYAKNERAARAAATKAMRTIAAAEMQSSAA